MDGFILADGPMSPSGSGNYMTLEDRSTEIVVPALQIRNKASAP